jgi:hypothetical protein
MAMYSNWNVLTLPIKADGKYKIGDTYHVSDRLYPKFWKFDGLVIQNIDYAFGVRLHFNLKDLLEAKPDKERLERIKGKKSPCQLRKFINNESKQLWKHLKKE